MKIMKKAGGKISEIRKDFFHHPSLTTRDILETLIGIHWKMKI
jgi:hypothetical protein